jgi:hypothetical protein
MADKTAFTISSATSNGSHIMLLLDDVWSLSRIQQSVISPANLMFIRFTCFELNAGEL